jgi:hypothetical protein
MKSNFDVAVRNLKASISYNKESSFVFSAFSALLRVSAVAVVVFSKLY